METLQKIAIIVEKTAEKCLPPAVVFSFLLGASGCDTKTIDSPVTIPDCNTSTESSTNAPFYANQKVDMGEGFVEFGPTALSVTTWTDKTGKNVVTLTKDEQTVPSNLEGYTFTAEMHENGSVTVKATCK